MQALGENRNIKGTVNINSNYSECPILNGTLINFKIS